MNSIYIDDSIILKSDVSNISVVEKLIDNLSGVCQFSDEIYGKLLLAVVEGVNNAMLHGNKLDPQKDVIVNYIIDNKEITFSIKDSGNGFDYKLIPDPTDAANLEKISGRGIYLMNHLSDNIEFSDGGSLVTMKFDLL